MKKYSGKSIFFLILGLFILSSALVFAQTETTETNTNSDESAVATQDLSDNPELQEINKKIEENKSKIENLKKATEEYAQKIEEYKGQSANLKNQLGLLDNQIIKIELDGKTLQMQIDKAKLEIDALNYHINKEVNEIEGQKITLSEYIKQIARDDQKSYLEILVLNDSFAEFFNQINYLETIQSDIQKIIDRLQILKQSVEVRKADKERQKEELIALKDQLTAKQNKLKEDQKAKELILTETKTSEIQFQKLLADARAKQSQIDADIIDLQNTLKDKISKLKKNGTSAASTLLNWPVSSRTVTSYFHDPEYPFRYIYEHPAIDIRSKQGSQIMAPADGYVARTKDAGMGYSYIILIHDNELSTVYGHVSAIYVKEDSYVKAGDVIGLSGGMPGTRGAGRMTTGPHLHFEVRLNGLPVNPLEYLP